MHVTHGLLTVYKFISGIDEIISETKKVVYYTKFGSNNLEKIFEETNRMQIRKLLKKRHNKVIIVSTL